MHRLVSLALPICLLVAADASGARDIVLLSGNANKVTINDGNTSPVCKIF